MRLFTRLTLHFLALSILPLIVIGWLAYQYGRQTVVDVHLDHLQSTNLLKRDNLNRWVDNGKRFLESLAQRPLVRQYATALATQSPESEIYALAHNHLVGDHLVPNLLAGSFVTLTVIRGGDGRIIASTEPGLAGQSRAEEELFIQGRQGTYVDTVSHLPSKQSPALHFSTPILNEQGDTVAVLVGHADLAELSRIVMQRTGLSASIDTYLVNPDGYFVTDPLFATGVALRDTVQTQGVQQCLTGASGVAYYDDYRGVPVIGVYDWMPERQMCILTQVDQSEAFAPIMALRNAVLGVGIGLAAVAVTASLVIARGMTAPLAALVRGAQAIGAGDLDVRVPVRGGDEIGRLGRAFNTMAANLSRSHHALQQARDDLEVRVEERTRELREREQMLRTLMDNLPSYVYVKDAAGRFLLANRTVINDLGLHSEADIIGKTDFDLFPRGLAERYRTVEAQVVRTGEPAINVEEPGIGTDGSREWFMTTTVPLRDSVTNEITHLVGISHDITERRRAEVELHQSRQMLQLVLDTIPQRIFWKDRDSRFVGCNRTFAEDCGVSQPEDIIGKSDLELDVRLEAEAYRVDDQEVMSSGTARLNYEETLTVPGKPLVWLRTSKLPLYDRHGNVIGVLGIYEDITERKEMEAQLQQTLEDLRRSNTELEQFAYVASHDLQEPLRVVTSYLQLLVRRYRDRLDGDAVEFIDYAVDGAARMKRLIEDLLAYSRVGTRGGEFAPTDCAEVLGHVLNSLQLMIEEAGALVTHDPLPTVMADASQLEQLFQNLIGNAVKFRRPAPPRVHVSAERRANEWLFAVRDNGIGIEPQHRERIFAVFQRLHAREHYTGTGIGLAICKRVVERHGGNIWVESQPGQGATFFFTLPIHEEI
jgi:PAS domain S-box-containing protein